MPDENAPGYSLHFQLQAAASALPTVELESYPTSNYLRTRWLELQDSEPGQRAGSDGPDAVKGVLSFPGEIGLEQIVSKLFPLGQISRNVTVQMKAAVGFNKALPISLPQAKPLSAVLGKTVRQDVTFDGIKIKVVPVEVMPQDSCPDQKDQLADNISALPPLLKPSVTSSPPIEILRIICGVGMGEGPPMKGLIP